MLYIYLNYPRRIIPENIHDLYGDFVSAFCRHSSVQKRFARSV